MWIIYSAFGFVIISLIIVFVFLFKKSRNQNYLPKSNKKTIQSNAFFYQKNHQEPTILFYGEAKELDVNIYSDKKVSVSFEELCRFISQLPKQTLENFFCLENQYQQVLEVSNNGKDDVYELIYFNISSNQRYCLIINGIELLNEIVHQYFIGENINQKYNFTTE
ncbi:MAG: hypothetical protein JXC31_04295 [Acholeplasmataceae bacterium]|nr:hypothetical protein [Acholeplasmataceae bacterium]